MDITLPQIDIEKKRNLFSELELEMTTQTQAGNFDKVKEISSQYKAIKKIIEVWDAIQILLAQYKETESLKEDPELGDLAVSELEGIETKLNELSKELEVLTLPKLPDDHKNAIVEVRAGTGGIEASLFAEEILRSYTRYINSLGFTIEHISTSYNEEGGIKESVLLVKGEEVYGKLRFESGVHRVQRVPVTESSGRIHTSAISLVVMPETEVKEIDIKPEDLRIETFRSSGPGGQSVNTTDSAVRITHKPTGITVSSQDSKSQHKNKDQAMSVLASKLYSLQESERMEKEKDIRSLAIKSGDRSAKIRTYNFPQGRVTDHRISKSWYNLPAILEGDLGEIVETVNTILRNEFAK